MQRPQGLSSSDPQQWLRQRVLSHDGQGGALLREFAKLDKFGSDTIATLDAACGDVQQVRTAMVAALVTGTRGEVATLVRRVLGEDRGNGLHCWHAVTQGQTPISCSTSDVNGTDEEREAAVMQEELTLFEHESKFSEIVPDSEKQLRREPCFPETCLNVWERT